MANVYLALANYQKKLGKRAIQLRINIGTKTIIKSTGFSVTPEQWNAESQQVNRKHANYKKYNLALDKIIEDTEREYAELIAQYGKISIESMKGKVMPETNIFKLIDGRIRHFKDMGAIPRMKRYETVKAKVQEFSPNLTITEISPQWLYSFQQHLSKKYHNKPSTIKADMNCIQTVWKEAFKMGVVSGTNPFEVIDYGTIKYAKKEVLTEAELSILANKQGLSPLQDLARDVFMFSYYTAGMRFTDVLLFSKDMIQGDTIHYTSGKTDKEMYIPVHDKLRAIIDKYEQTGATMWGLITETQAMKRHNQISGVQTNLRKALQIAVTASGIKKHISMHCARHTFAQIATEVGGDIYNVKNALGHSDIATTQLYLRQNNTKLLELFSKVYS